MKNVAELQSIFNRYIAENAFSQAPEGLYEPVNYIMNLGGKRIRPVLLLMAYNLYRDNVEQALPAAFTVEMFHNFTLLHDDIMDEADVRRGKPAVHKKYGVNAGILSGDVMQIYAYDYLLRLESRGNLPELLQIFNKMAIEVCEGQQYDMEFETRHDVKIEEYLKMIALKTAVLLGTSMEMGAVIAEASTHCRRNLYDFGKKIGIAFQLQDDILDTYGDPAVFGKKIGGDIVQNKKTFLVLKTLELASNPDRKRLREWLENSIGDEAEKIEIVRAIFDKYEVRRHAEILKEGYLDDAFAALDLVACGDARKTGLRDLANRLMMRVV